MFWKTKYEIKQDLSDKVVAITGASMGIGRTTALALAAKNAHLVLMGRSKEKHESLIAEIKQRNAKVDFIALELGSLKSVAKAAKDFVALNLPLDILINNAGLGFNQNTTEDGFEMTFGVNHLGHFLLTYLLLDKLKASKEARIVTLSSSAHYQGKPYDYSKDIKNVDGVTRTTQAYFNSKLANAMHSHKLSQLLQGTSVTTYAVHPGVVATGLWRNFWWPIQGLMKMAMIDEEQGSYTTLYCATEPSLAKETGKYYDHCKEKEPLALVKDQKLIDELWDKSIELVKDYIPAQ